MNLMKSTFRVLFYLRKNEVNKNGNSSIMVRITINGEQVQFSSKLQIKPELWDTKNGKAVGKSAESMNTNRLLESISAKVNELYYKQLSDYGYVSPEKIKNIILGVDTDRKRCYWNIFLNTMSSIYRRLEKVLRSQLLIVTN